MPQPQPGEVVRAGNEVRGTQSFVYIMVSIWRRPSLTGLEVLWRWAIGSVSLWVLATWGWRVWLTATQGTGDAARVGLGRFDVTDPLAASQQLVGAIAQIMSPALHVARWLVPLLLAAWVVVAAVGRTAVLRRMDASLHPRRVTLVVLGAVRIAFLAAVVVLWLWLLAWAGGVAITGPVVHGLEPNLVLYFALIITITLVVFVAWALSSWVLSIAPVLAILRGLGAWESLRAATKLGPLRGKLMEINLVMGIVKIALVVLAMVFSATPLPFQSYTTDGFLHVWWAGVAVLYFIGSDFFHVVRTAVYVGLCREYDAR